MQNVRRVIAVIVLLVAAPALAQDPPAPSLRLEIGARYWVSSGSTERSHDASSFSPILGNPTSTLAYTDLDANSVELYARKGFAEDWYVKGYVGLGRINNGTFTDQDFLVLGGSTYMAETISATSGKLRYASVDIGRNVWRSGNSSVSVFAGYHQWSEHVDAHGLSDSFGPAGLPDTTLVITNDLTWRSLRLGAEMRSVRGRTSFTAEVALVPYAEYRNEDSHYLRQNPNDLGPVPNVIATGKGRGVQVDLEVRRSYPEIWGLDFALGYRYWRLDSFKGTQVQAGLEFPIVDLMSERQGVTFTVSRTW
jgi:hypothetical protein